MITEASTYLKNTCRYMKVARDLWSLEMELGAPGFWNPFAVAIRAQ